MVINKISKLIIQWGTYRESQSTVDYRYWSIAFNNFYTASIIGSDTRYLNWLTTSIEGSTFDKNILKTKFLCGQGEMYEADNNEMLAFAVGC